jgi:hypothetical protein
MRAVTTTLLLAVVAIAGMSASGCKSKIRSYEGQRCSTDQDDDPLYTCTPAQDLVCITTQTIPVRGTTSTVDVYTCQLTCTTDEVCTNGEICCTGKVYGKDFGSSRGCVPLDRCDERANGTPDGGRPTPRDAGGSEAGPAADARDAAAAETGADAAQAGGGDADAPADGGDAAEDGPAGGG